MFGILSILITLPLIGALFILFLARGEEQVAARNARQVALWTTGFTFFLSLYLWFSFENYTPEFQFSESLAFFSNLNFGYRLGIDGISVLLILLSTALMPLCILASWSINKRVREYMIAFLVLESLMIGTFAALDIILFYIFFEAVLIPMFLIIGIWGGENRVYAAYKFFLYTLAGSVLMLVAILYLVSQVGTTDISVLIAEAPSYLSRTEQIWLWLAFFASFAVKVPMWPVHTWLPDAHVQAPTAGSVILAGVLLKMGGYGFLRFSLPLFPEATQLFAPFVFTLSIIAVIYTSLVAFVQTDMKKLIAYSSVAHMGLVTAGIFSLNSVGIQGALFMMLSHGIVSGALFLCVGVLYDRLHTKEIARYGGLAKNMPVFSVIFMLFTMASVGLPGTSSFIAEIAVIIGTFKSSPWVAAGVTTGIILGAAYMLYLYRRVVFGKLEKAEVAAMSDLTVREVLCFAPLIVLTLVLGIYATPVMDVMKVSVENLVKALGV